MGRFRPHIIFSAAITLDGKLATRTGDSKLSSKADKNRVHKLRGKVDAILIGKNTAEVDEPILSVHHQKKTNPIRIVLDSNATIKNNSRILRTSSKIPTIIAVGESASKKTRGIVVCPRANASLAEGIPNVLQMMEMNCNVAIGTDNVMINSPDLFREMDFYGKQLWAFIKNALNQKIF